MNGKEVVELAHRTYLEELAQFIVAQAQHFGRGRPEAPTLRPDNQALFQGHYRVDFVGHAADGATAPLDLIPSRRIQLDSPREGLAGGVNVRIEGLAWDDVEISHNAPGDLRGAISPWFEAWYDPNGRRKPIQPGAPLDAIHWVGVGENMLLVDFGSASPSAFWALVDVLREAGATSITVRQSPAAV